MLVILPREYSESLDLNYKNNQKNVFGMQCVIIFYLHVADFGSVALLHALRYTERDDVDIGPNPAGL